eukprot:TRINITY_DN28493_c0_g1_i1.p1 TRINITY_DN28493_c0_g1~~TRINITY_DN28493_c0_g1_i1.p1  ORF type:complete len:485 (+),score=80.71 TRINITY_DN28493_c0_g1_i1:36-1457(+)
MANRLLEEEAASNVAQKIISASNDDFESLADHLMKSDSVSDHSGVILAWKGLCRRVLRDPKGPGLELLTKSINVVSHKGRTSSAHSGTHGTNHWLWVIYKDVTKMSIWLTSFSTLITALSHDPDSDFDDVMVTVNELILLIGYNCSEFVSTNLVVTHIISCITSLQTILMPRRMSCTTLRLAKKPASRVATTPLPVFSTFEELASHLRNGVRWDPSELFAADNRVRDREDIFLKAQEVNFTGSTVDTEPLRQLLVECMLCSSGPTSPTQEHIIKTITDYLPTEERLKIDIAQWLSEATELLNTKGGLLPLYTSIRIVLDFFISETWSFDVIEAAAATTPDVGSRFLGAFAALICGLALPVSKGYSGTQTSEMLCRSMNILVSCGQLPASLASVFIILEDLPRSEWSSLLLTVVRYLISDNTNERKKLTSQPSITNIIVQNPVLLAPIAQPRITEKRALNAEPPSAKRNKEEVI